MSATLQNIEYNLTDGIFDVLNNAVTYSAVTYPVHKSVPKPAPADYVYIGGIILTENGTKESFIYEGTIQVQTICDYNTRADMNKAQGINGVVRGRLKSSKAGVFSIGSNTLIVFSLESSTQYIEEGIGTTKIKIIDIYNFSIE